MSLTEEDIRRVVKETIREEREANEDKYDKENLKFVTAILKSFGIDDADQKEFKEDFRYLRRWRQGSERVTGLTLTAVVTLLVGGLASALILGIKTILGKS